MSTQVFTGDGGRLDVLTSSKGLTRSRAAQLIKEGQAMVNGVIVLKPSYKTEVGDQVVLSLPAPEEPAAQPEAMPLHIIYQDEDMAVVVKPCGMVVHPAAGNETGTLVNALLYHLDGLSGIGGEKRPGIVHRLDKDTSGLLLVAKNDQAHLKLSRQLADRTMEKHYFAVVAGTMKEEKGQVDAPIGRSQRDRKKMAVVSTGRDALSKWQVVNQQQDRALLDIHLITGRTHQIRVHMAYIHHPVLGDPLYGVRNMPKAPRLMLHAYSLACTHPATGQWMRFTAPPDDIFGMPADYIKP